MNDDVYSHDVGDRKYSSKTRSKAQVQFLETNDS